MTRVLVLGGAGFIGVAACKELMRRGVETIAAGRKERPHGVFTGYALDRARRDLGFEPSALEDALAETLAWYRVERPSHACYANRAQELAIAGAV